MSGHLEIITCPNCKSHEIAAVQHTRPFWSYVHNCKRCGYIIMESEWNKKDEPSLADSDLLNYDREKDKRWEDEK